jgi:hypothetical protein
MVPVTSFEVTDEKQPLQGGVLLLPARIAAHLHHGMLSRSPKSKLVKQWTPYSGKQQFSFSQYK